MVNRLEVGEGLPEFDSPWAMVTFPEGKPYPPTRRPPSEVLWRNFYYRRIRSSAECDRHMLLDPQGQPRLAFHLTAAWANPPGGMIPLPSDADPPIPHTHAAQFIGRIPDQQRFRFGLLWSDWGENGNGIGYMPYEYFDRYVFECWAVYGRPEVLRLYKLKELDEGRVRWSAHDEDDNRIYAFEVRDARYDERRAWTFVIERDGVLEVEELYVRPEYRRLGHGRWLADRVAQLAHEKGMPIRLWVAFADCKLESESNYPALVATASRLGVQFRPCPVPWAAYFGTNEQPGEVFPVEPVTIPERPRVPRNAVLATVLALGIGDSSPVRSNGTVPTTSPIAPMIAAHSFPKPGTPEWGKMNQRRAELIRKDVSGTLSESERIEYESLQRLSLAALEEAFPYPEHDEERERLLDERLRKQEASGG